MYENIDSAVPNICRGPIYGTWCSIDTTNPSKPLLITKNESGGLVDIHSVSGGMDPDGLVCFEYVGPVDIEEYVNGLEFVTLERVTSSSCVTKVWEINNWFKTLNLKYEQVYFDHSGYSFNVIGMAVEYYNQSFAQHCDKGVSVLYVDDASKISAGMEIFLGPSADAEYTGLCESVGVSFVVPSQNKVHLNQFLQNQYVIGDQISFYKYFYIISKTGVLGDEDQGMIIKVDPVTGYVVNSNTDPLYRQINKIKWCPYFRQIGMLYNANILYSNPYNYYTNSKSQFLNNYYATKKDFYEINDIAFKDNLVYKLSAGATFKTDDGNFITEYWGGRYNFQEDNLVPYANTVAMYSDDNYTIREYGETTFNFIVRDQFFVGLRDVELTVDVIEGDPSATLDPLGGNIVSDINGRCSIDYIAGDAMYSGMSRIQILTGEGSPYSGSANVYSSSYVRSFINLTGYLQGMSQKGDATNYGYLESCLDLSIGTNVRAFSFFGVPGGNWVPNGDRDLFDTLLASLANKGEIQGFLDTPSFGPGGSGLTLRKFGEYYGGSYGDNAYNISNRITLVESFTSTQSNWLLKEFKVYPPPTEGTYPGTDLYQEINMFNMQLSQLKHSRHSYWMDSEYYDEVIADLSINQFVFVQDAIPVFYSKKNPIDTNIWLRLRPYAANLDASTLIMQVRVVSSQGDTRFVDITNLLTIEQFDAGGGLLGIEITYDPAEYFPNNAIVYVKLSLYDVVGNFISIDYWFTTIHDYTKPYLDNQDPDIEEEGVPVDSSIYFEIKDNGQGVDINTFHMSVNSMAVQPQTITRVSRNQYNILYEPPVPFLYNNEVTVAVYIADLADQPNWLYDSYTFYTDLGSSVLLTGFYPRKCTYDLSRFSDVGFLALDTGSGIDISTLKVQIAGKDVTNHPYMKILPIIHRVL